MGFSEMTVKSGIDRPCEFNISFSTSKQGEKTVLQLASFQTSDWYFDHRIGAISLDAFYLYNKSEKRHIVMPITTWLLFLLISDSEHVSTDLM